MFWGKEMSNLKLLSLYYWLRTIVMNFELRKRVNHEAFCPHLTEKRQTNTNKVFLIRQSKERYLSMPIKNRLKSCKRKYHERNCPITLFLSPSSELKWSSQFITAWFRKVRLRLWQWRGIWGIWAPRSEDYIWNM